MSGDPKRPEAKAENTPRASAVSHAFHSEIPDAAVRRSLIISASASTIGMIMFGIVQGTIINFFFQDLDLKQRIPWFLGLQWLAGAGSIVGSWIQERWGLRRPLMFLCCGGSRVIWLLVGLLPLLYPELSHGGGMFGWLSAAIVLFYFIHSVGANAWLTWMSDLVPPRYQHRFWILRQVGTSSTAAIARLLAGYFLERNHSAATYAIIFGIATLMGVIDVSMYFFVEHRRAPLHPQRRSILAESLKRLEDGPYRRLCGMYFLWSAANCIMQPTVYYFMRDHVQMGYEALSLSATVALVGYTAFSLVWGRLGRREGHRRSVIVCLIVQNACTILFFLCAPGTTYLVTAALSLEQIGLGGVNLFMFPMLIDYTRGKGGGRAVGMAAFTAMLSVVSFLACILTDEHIFKISATAMNAATGTIQYSPSSSQVLLAVIFFAFILRTASLYLAWRLPPCETQLAAGPGTLILRRMSEGPLRAAQATVNTAIGWLGWGDEPETPTRNSSDKKPK